MEQKGGALGQLAGSGFLAEAPDGDERQHDHSGQAELRSDMDKHIVNMGSVEELIRIRQIQFPPLVGADAQNGIGRYVSQSVAHHCQPFGEGCD